MSMEKARYTYPRFAEEGWALYEGGDYNTIVIKGELRQLGKKKGLDFIGIKPDAPDWAKDEYRDWLALHGKE